MHTIRINSQDPEIEIIQQAANVIRRGGIIVCPTDTVYGLMANAMEENAVRHLFQMKNRPTNKPLQVLVQNIEAAKKLAFIDKKREEVLSAVWPGAITVILEKRGVVSELLTAGKRTVGLRIPNYKITQLLMEQLDAPIVATSANFSGEPPLLCADEIDRIFRKSYPRPDLILDVGCLSQGSPSTILDLYSSQPKISRVGPVTKEQLLDILK